MKRASIGIVMYFIVISMMINLWAQPFEIERDGITYTCQSKNAYGASCWQKCTYPFHTCLRNCGAGVECFQKCPSMMRTRTSISARTNPFPNCARNCNDNSPAFKKLCWEQCDSPFYTCVRICGKGADCMNKCPLNTTTCQNSCRE